MPISLLAALAQFAANPMYSTLVMYVAIAAIFYFILFRPQQQQRKQHEATIMSLKRGEEIVTAGGIVGEVVNIVEKTSGTPGSEDRVTIRSGESRLVVERGRIARILSARATGTTSA